MRFPRECAFGGQVSQNADPYAVVAEMMNNVDFSLILQMKMLMQRLSLRLSNNPSKSFPILKMRNENEL
jgi:hypothetical protein